MSKLTREEAEKLILEEGRRIIEDLKQREQGYSDPSPEELEDEEEAWLAKLESGEEKIISTVGDTDADITPEYSDPSPEELEEMEKKFLEELDAEKVQEFKAAGEIKQYQDESPHDT